MNVTGCLAPFGVKELWQVMTVMFSVKSQVSTARFPFPTTVVDLGNGRYRLHGMLDERLADETVRRNYECVILFTDSAGYRADSLRVWQSH